MIKKILFVIPLLTLASCNNNSSVFNVEYYYNYDLKAYKVIDDKGREYRVKPEDYYEIKVYYYKTTGSGVEIYNEYYLVSEKLYVYIK